jgi:hypothetical protein
VHAAPHDRAFNSRRLTKTKQPREDPPNRSCFASSPDRCAGHPAAQRYQRPRASQRLISLNVARPHSVLPPFLPPIIILGDPEHCLLGCGVFNAVRQNAHLLCTMTPVIGSLMKWLGIVQKRHDLRRKVPRLTPIEYVDETCEHQRPQHSENDRPKRYVHGCPCCMMASGT